MKIVTQIQMNGPRPYGPHVWDGISKHPILGLTMEEIKAHAEGTAAHYASLKVKSDLALKMPDKDQQHAYHLQRAAERTQEWIETVSKTLTPSQHMPNEIRSESYKL